jgi:hypothetical protein
MRFNKVNKRFWILEAIKLVNSLFNEKLNFSERLVQIAVFFSPSKFADPLKYQPQARYSWSKLRK